MQQQSAIRRTHNLFLHRFIDNEQTKSVSLMKLDTHQTLYRDGVENKYITNLVLNGRNFIHLYAVFQNQLTLSMGVWHVYEDILQVQQWDKNIVISTKNKVVGLVYEDCMLKNSFMLTLDFLDLGFREQIQTVCDKTGYYMVIATSRQILLCVSQKAVHRYKAKPFMHRKMSIIEQKIIWNRSEYQSVVDVVKFEYDDFQLAKVQGFHFCDQYLYFMGHTSKIGNKKMLFQIHIQQIFLDNEKESLVLEFTKLDEEVRQSYVIRRQAESQFLVIKKNNSIYIKNQKGQFPIQNQLFKKSQKSESTQHDTAICRKNNNPQIFPLHVFYKNTVYIYERVPTSGLSVSGCFSTRSIKLPQNLQVEFCDIQDGLFSYCNLYETGLVFLKNTNNVMIDEKQQKLHKIVLREYFGNIIDFNIGQNIVIIENTYQKKCNIKLLRKGIVESSKPFIMVPKKIQLDKIPNTKSIRCLEDLLLNQYEMSEPEYQLKRIREFLLSYLIIQTKTDVSSLYRLVAGPSYELVLPGLTFWTLVKNYENTKNSWFVLIWTSQKELLYYKINFNQNTLTLIKTISQTHLYRNQITLPIFKIKQYLVCVNEQALELNLYNWKTNILTSIKLPNQAKNTNLTMARVNYKNITFKKKDKDYFFLQVIVLLDGDRLQVWEVSVDSGLFKLSHCTQNVGEGLPILLPSQSPILNSAINLSSHQFRAITSPEYVLSDKTIKDNRIKSPTIIKMHILQHQTQNYLFLINSKQQLQVYKKIYCSSSNPNSTFGSIDTGFLYYRQPLQLNLVKKFKYNEATAFVDIGCGMLRLCNLVFFKGAILELQQNIRTCFKISEQQIWSILWDSKIKPLITQGKIISHYLTTTIPSKQTEQILSIESTNQNYIIYSRGTFEVFDKQLNITWSELNSPQDAILENNQNIISVCAFDHYVAVSYYNYCVEDAAKDEYKSIKFKLRIYNTITKKKIIEKQNAYEEPVLHIRYVAPDKLIVVTSSNISINTIKNNQTLENPRNKHYSKRAMLSCFCYHPEKVGSEPGYMLFGGLYGGLSFHVGQWIDKDKLDEMWFQNLKCGIRQVQIFHYGDASEMLKAVVADDSDNIVVLDLWPKCSYKIADFHLGSAVNSIKKRNQIPYIASEDGCIRALFPIKLKDPEISFLDFQEEITKSIPELGGFNNHDSRLLDQRKKTYKLPPQGNIVDGEVIRSFLSLTEVLKNNIYEASEISLESVKNELLGFL